MTWRTIDWIADFGDGNDRHREITPFGYGTRLLLGLVMLAVIAFFGAVSIATVGMGVWLAVYFAFVKWPLVGICIFAIVAVAYATGFARFLKVKDKDKSEVDDGKCS